MKGIRGEGERERSRIEKVRIVEKKKAEAGEMELEAKDKIDNTPSGEFAELILKGLIDEGYSGYELLDEFRVRLAKMEPAVEDLLEEVRNLTNGNGDNRSYIKFVKELLERNDGDPIKAKAELWRRYVEQLSPIEYKIFQEGIKIGENNVNKSLSVDLYASGYKPERIAEMLEVSLEQVMEWIEEK